MNKSLSPHGNFTLTVKENFKRIIKNTFIKEAIKCPLNLFVNIFAYLKGMKFPEKYPWDWKLELLTYQFEPESVSLFKNIIKPGMTVLDLGGHLGYYTRLFSQLVRGGGKVYVFEPSEDTLKLLQHNIRKLKNVELIKKAVCDKNGTIEFNKTFSHSGSNSILKPDWEAETTTIPCVTLDTFVKERSINVDVIKMDVEGAEPLVFKGARETMQNTKHLSILMEFVESYIEKTNQTPKEHFQSLQDLGFTIYTILPNGNTKLLNIKDYNWGELSRSKFVINLFLKK